MNSNLLASLLADLWDDIRAPAMLWQLAAIAVSVALGWTLSRAVHRAVDKREHLPHSSAMQLGLDSFSRVLTPLLVLAFVVAARYGLGQFQKVHLLRVAIPIVASLALIRFAFYLLHRVFARGGKPGGTLLLAEKVFALLVWLGVALYITGLWPDLHAFLDDIVIPMGKHKISLATILQALLSVGVTLIAAMWAGAALESRLMAMEGMHTSLRVVTARFGRAVLILVAVLLSLSLVGIDLTVLSVFGGALGVGLGLGLQKIASNYVSGFVILLDRSLKIGDIISVDKYAGRVTRINTRYTVIDGLEGIETVVPNEMLVSGVVQNYSLSDSALRLATRITVAYDSDIDEVLALMETTAAAVPRVVADPAPFALLRGFGADGIDVEVGYWITDPENGRGNLVSEVNKAVWHAFRAAGISVPFPQREIRIVNDEPRAGVTIGRT